jgi:hypothetical protein
MITPDSRRRPSIDRFDRSMHPPSGVHAGGILYVSHFVGAKKDEVGGGRPSEAAALSSGWRLSSHGEVGLI